MFDVKKVMETTTKDVKEEVRRIMTQDFEDLDKRSIRHLYKMPKSSLMTLHAAATSLSVVTELAMCYTLLHKKFLLTGVVFIVSAKATRLANLLAWTLCEDDLAVIKRLEILEELEGL